jgi:hypothetical protein
MQLRKNAVRESQGACQAASRKVTVTLTLEDSSVGREPRLESGSRELAVVRCRYLATISEDIEGWK